MFSKMNLLTRLLMFSIPAVIAIPSLAVAAERVTTNQQTVVRQAAAVVATKPATG